MKKLKKICSLTFCDCFRKSWKIDFGSFSGPKMTKSRFFDCSEKGSKKVEKSWKKLKKYKKKLKKIFFQLFSTFSRKNRNIDFLIIFGMLMIMIIMIIIIMDLDYKKIFEKIEKSIFGHFSRSSSSSFISNNGYGPL